MGKRMKASGGLFVMELTKKEKENKKKLPEVLFLSALLYIETALTLACVITVAQIEVQPVLLWAGLLVSMAFMVALQLCQGKKWAVLMIAYLALLGTFLWKGKERIGDGFLHLENAVLELVNRYYGSNILFLRTSFKNTEWVVAEFLLAAAQLLLFVYAGALFQNSASLMALLLMALAAFGGLAVGLVPQELVFAGTIICIVVTAAMKMMPETVRLKGRKRWWVQSEEGGRRQRSRVAAMAGGLLALLFLIVSAIVNDSLYREKLKRPETKEQVLEIYANLGKSSFWDGIEDYLEGRNVGLKNLNPAGLFGSSSGSTGISGGQFSQGERIRFQNITALKVTMPDIGQSVYLKGYNGAVYSRKGWQDLSNQQLKPYRELSSKYSMDAQDMQVRFLKLFCEGAYRLDAGGRNFDNSDFLYYGKMTVDYITASKKYIYGPYFWDSEGMGSLSYEQDSYILPERRAGNFEFDFYMVGRAVQPLLSSGFLADSNDYAYASFERDYRKYVYSIYTQMPAGHEKLQEMAQGLADLQDSIYAKIAAVESFLSGYEYTLAPGQMPAGADFVDYFLFENKKGYCMHFASSAVLLLRSLGVPARYAEGYLITASDLKNASTTGMSAIQKIQEDGTLVLEEAPEKMVEVKDYSAHAWVEVYLDQIGWMPFEMTKGFHNGRAGDVEALPEEIIKEAELLPTATPLPTNTPIPGRERPLPTAPASPAPEPTVPPELLGQENDGISGDGKPGNVTGGPEGNPGAEEKINFWEEWNEKLPAPIKWIFKGMFALSAILLLIFARYRAAIAWNRRRKPGRRAQVLRDYHWMESYLKEEKLQHGTDESYEDFSRRVKEKSTLASEDFALFQELALRAGFSREKILPEEAYSIFQERMRMRERLLARCSRMRAIYLKFVKLF